MENKRQFPRFRIDEPAMYQRYQDAPAVGSVAADISLGGVKLNVNEFIALNTVLNVNLHLPGQVQVVPARAVVVWVRERPYRDDCWEIGLQLLGDSLTSSTIRDYINRRRFDVLK